MVDGGSTIGHVKKMARGAERSNSPAAPTPTGVGRHRETPSAP